MGKQIYGYGVGVTVVVPIWDDQKIGTKEVATFWKDMNLIKFKFVGCFSQMV